MPAGEPAAAERHHHQADVGRLARQLEPDRALSRHHVGLVERVHDGHAPRRRASCVGLVRWPRRSRPPPARTSPPYWRTAATLASGAPAGITSTVATLPSARRREGHRLRVVAGAGRHHARRSARARTGRAIMFVAPRALNEPVSWRFSAFSSTLAPTRRDSSPEGSTGVSRTLPDPALGRRMSSRPSLSAVAARSTTAARPRLRSPRARPSAAPRRPRPLAREALRRRTARRPRSHQPSPLRGR